MARMLGREGVRGTERGSNLGPRRRGDRGRASRRWGLHREPEGGVSLVVVVFCVVVCWKKEQGRRGKWGRSEWEQTVIVR